MTRDPQFDPTDDTDAELSSLFSAMKQDRAPPDVEARLLQALAATSAAAAGAAVAKLGPWHKVALVLDAHGVATSAIIGGLCGVLACGMYVVVEGRAPAQGAPPSVATSLASTAARAPDAPDRGAPTGGDPGAAGAPPDTPRARLEAPSQAPGKPLVPPAGATESAVSPGVSASPPPDAEPIPGPAAAAIEAGTGPGKAPSEPSDLLRKELLLVRSIATLVDGGRCAEARTAIARYGIEHAAGQLSGEVAVLAARCQGR